MRSATLALCLSLASATCASAQSAQEDASAPPSPALTRDAPAHPKTGKRRCAPRRAACVGPRLLAPGSAAAVVAPATAPMLPPLGGHVWLHEDPPLFDPYRSAGPWYKPWVHEGTNVVQWRYGFPGGHVGWYEKLGWRPGFGWF